MTTEINKRTYDHPAVTPDTTDRFWAVCYAIARGAKVLDACREAGVPRSTLQYWELAHQSCQMALWASRMVARLRLQAELTDEERAFMADPVTPSEMLKAAQALERGDYDVARG